MGKRSDTSGTKTEAEARAARLKIALMANLARRKAQGRARLNEKAPVAARKPD